MARNKSGTFYAPAGRYVISDPCYVLSDEDYDEFIGQLSMMPSIVIRGHTMMCFNTAYGDGCFHDNQGEEYPVDAGCIALIPIEIVNAAKMDDNDLMVAGAVTTFTGQVECSYDDHFGVIKYGDVEITTNPGFCDPCGEFYGPDEDHDDCENEEYTVS